MSNNLFEEVDSMLEVSSLIYTVAKLNNWDDAVGYGKLHDPDFLHTLPRKSTEVVDWFRKNEHVIREINDSDEAKTKFNVDFDLKALDLILNRDKNDSSGDATLEVLDDNFAFKGNDAEIVYAITKNPDTKRLTVIFRGSQASKDWAQNFKFRKEEVSLSSEDWDGVSFPNPNTKVLNDFEKVSIHSGFAEYLFVLPQKAEKDHMQTKFTEIMNEVFTRLSDPSCKDYSVCFTGHSLGAALATLAAAATAISDDVKRPVQLITFAAPHVGKLDFVEAFTKLEKEGRIQHLRVTNDDDSVPQGLGILGYRHTGIHLNLREPSWFNKSPYYITRTKTRGFLSWTNNMDFDLIGWTFGGISEPHKLRVHRERLLHAKEDLEKQTLDDLYNDPKLRGF